MKKGIITLHGHVRTKEMPLFGAKVLGLRSGQMDLHGKPQTTTWSNLATTANKGDTSLTLKDPVDWVAGDEIVVASTSKDGNDTQVVNVVSVDTSRTTVTFTPALKETHWGVTSTSGLPSGKSLEIRAEVGLLTHNVKVRGSMMDDPLGNGLGEDEFGATIMIFRHGLAQARLSNVEITHSGQAFRLGRYSVHFHLSGDMSASYVKKCSMHHTFNRAITSHGVEKNTYEDNVAFHVMGHTYFIEDGVEMHNKFLHNLGLHTFPSMHLINTDQLPATFWITNPNNIWKNNAAAGSPFGFGFWFDVSANNAVAVFLHFLSDKSNCAFMSTARRETSWSKFAH